VTTSSRSLNVHIVYLVESNWDWHDEKEDALDPHDMHQNFMQWDRNSGPSPAQDGSDTRA
jgi:hypothetical protein